MVPFTLYYLYEEQTKTEQFKNLNSKVDLNLIKVILTFTNLCTATDYTFLAYQIRFS